MTSATVVSLTRTQVRTVYCPGCGVQAGQRCLGADGKLRTANHLERVVLARQTYWKRES